MITATKYGLVRTELEVDPKEFDKPYWTMISHVLYNGGRWLLMGEHHNTREATSFHYELVDKINEGWAPNPLEVHVLESSVGKLDDNGMPVTKLYERTHHKLPKIWFSKWRKFGPRYNTDDIMQKYEYTLEYDLNSKMEFFPELFEEYLNEEETKQLKKDYLDNLNNLNNLNNKNTKDDKDNKNDTNVDVNDNAT